MLNHVIDLQWRINWYKMDYDTRGILLKLMFGEYPLCSGIFSGAHFDKIQTCLCMGINSI